MDNWEKRRIYFTDEIKPKITGKVPHRIELLLARAYMRGDLEGQIEELEDVELDRIYGVGPGTLADIRKVFPAPCK